MSKQLKPCPFCGFKPDPDEPDCIYPVSINNNIWNLVCYAIGGGCDASMLAGSPEECIEKWNRRE